MSPATEWLDRYLERFVILDKAGADPDGEEMAALLSCYSPNVRYYDVPTGGSWEGHDAIKNMFIGGYRFGDNEKHILSRYTNGSSYTFECESIGDNKTHLGRPGAKWVLRACSVGTFDDEGRVIEQHDYWDRKSWAVQVGLEEPLSFAAELYPESEADSA